jgi:hypothetical protein
MITFDRDLFTALSHYHSQQQLKMEETKTMDMEVQSTPVSAPEPTPTPVSRSLAVEYLDEGSMPKSEPTMSPSTPWVATEMTPNNYLVYPPVASYDFQIAPKKRVDRYLDVYYVGVKDPLSKRRWAFTIGTPTCYVQFAKTTFEGEAPNSRALLCPLYFDGSVALPDHAPFLGFLDHIDGISNKLKGMMTALGRDVADWQSPLKIENGFIVGLQAKIKTDAVRNAIVMNNGQLKCCLKMTCVYFAKERSGISFELIEAIQP